ncbi:hypothetical protein [Streptacidiphilus carbonis]|uniref:hypothetical protein n=1 Tax=Streptacidiphilus carbonis TaxID=105422 RepID=UPI0005AB237B|nr:hypothetical protein [Streptacidiphilus carbonis]
MIWLTWRQFRAQAIVAAVILTAFGIALALTGSGLADLYTSSGLASCRIPSACSAMTTTFLDEMKADSAYPLMYFIGFGILVLAPPLIGAFWGAPTITREAEGHTFRLVWHQSVTPTRWAMAKLALLGLASTAFAGLISLMVTWWAAPIDRAGGFPIGGGSQISRFSKQIFDARGIVPLGYAALGFVLGITLGVLIRRTVPAMAATLVVVAAIQFVVPNWVRPGLVTPVTVTTPVLSASALNQMQVHSSGQLTLPVDIPGAWIVTNRTVTPNGHVFTLPNVPQCGAGTYNQCVSWIAGQHLRQVVTYQPATRFWEFQGLETAVLLAAAAASAAACVLWIRRFRLS